MAMKVFAVILLLALVLELAPSVTKVQADAGGAKRGKCNTGASDADQWDEFIQRHNKTYANCTEETMRLGLLRKNRARIASHNADAAKGKFSYTLAENDLSDLTDDEYKSLLGNRVGDVRLGVSWNSRKKRAVYPPSMPIYKNTVSVSTLPATVDWRTSGWVGPVVNQGRCGSCWAYSATGAIEAQYKNKTKTLVALSQQNLIDCSSPQGNMGCNGGNPALAFWYVMQNGQQTAATYPSTSYSTGTASTCKYLSTKSVVKLSGWRYVDFNNELALQQAVAKVGPVSIAVDARSTNFMQYSSGVFNYPLCSSSTANLNHAVQVVGYGTYLGQPYWLVKNSWGTSWGQSGYMMLARNANNMCGVASYATFPVVSTAKVTTGR